MYHTTEHLPLFFLNTKAKVIVKQKYPFEIRLTIIQILFFDPICFTCTNNGKHEF